MSHLLFCGDPHGDFSAVRDHVKHGAKPAAIVLLGDYDLERPLRDELVVAREFEVPVYWIHGNHDTDRDHWFDNLFAGGLGESIDGRVVEIVGVKIAGLGGIFRERIWHPHVGEPRFRSPEEWLASHAPDRRWRGGVPRSDCSSIWWQTYEGLWEQKADVLVTHEAPSCLERDGRRLGFKELDELAEAMGVTLIVHGHHHFDYDATLSNGISVRGVGKREVWRWAP